ncbi:hypothetical protein ABXS75_10940 [Roseburia hominis]
MDFTKSIYEKATMQGIVKYLLYGFEPCADQGDLEMRLEKAHQKFDRTAGKYGKASAEELINAANELEYEISLIYTEIGMKLGRLLQNDMTGGELVAKPKEKAGIAHKNISYWLSDRIARSQEEAEKQESVIDCLMRIRVNETLEKMLEKDAKYSEVREKVVKATKKMNHLGLTREQWNQIDEVLSADNERANEYGRVAYRQGIADGVALLVELIKGVS